MVILKRRLSALVHADLAGFTRLMETGESQTFRHLKTAQSKVWRPAIAAGGGRLVGTAGDAMLAEFASALAAVSAAIDIQERMRRLNDRLAEDQRLLFRIGVHLGEVIVDDEDQNIFGDGVNIAARIQALAEPGGIAVSRAVRDIAGTFATYAFIDGGEHRPKNVSRAVQIYHVRSSAAAGADTTTRVVPEITLRFEGADSSGRRFAFDLSMSRLLATPAGLVIGRVADQCELVLAHGTVSRRHARIRFAAESLQIEDLGSTNGTLVDGSPLTPGAPVTVILGTNLRFGDIALTVRHA
jgi:class 3 adenylate cyclase